MKGERNGVARQIKDEEKRAIHIHCFTHSLNLAVGGTIKGSKVIKESLETTHEITKLIKKSQKRDGKLNEIKESIKIEDGDENDAMTITLLCPTRWTVRAKSLNSIADNFDYLQTLWQWSVDNCSDTEMKARIRGVDIHMRTFDYMYGVILGELILKHSDNLSKSLQSPTSSAVEGHHLALVTVKTLKTLRTDDSFDMFWENTLSITQSKGIDAPKLPRKRQPPKTLNQYFGHSNTTPAHPANAKDMYRKHYFEALDLVISAIQERFEQRDYKIYASCEELLLKAAKNKAMKPNWQLLSSFMAMILIKRN